MADATTTGQQSSGATATRLSPSVRRLLHEHDLDAGDVQVSRGGRVPVGDVEQVLNDRSASGPAGRVSARTQGESASDRTVSAPRAAEAPAPGDAAGRRAQDPTAAALSERIADLAERVRAGQLTPDEGGGTFTNTASCGVMRDTTILHPAQVGILATTCIGKRPVVIADELGGDALAIHQMSYLCPTDDHRSVDGADAARFLTDLEPELETADLLGGAA